MTFTDDEIRYARAYAERFPLDQVLAERPVPSRPAPRSAPVPLPDLGDEDRLAGQALLEELVLYNETRRPAVSRGELPPL